MNNTESAFIDAELSPDVDRDRLLAQIAQGLLTAHARLDLMEERLVQATSRAVVEQLTSAVSTIKANGQTSSAQLTEIKEVLQVLHNARHDFSSAATQAIDKQVDRIQYAQSDALSKLSTNQGKIGSMINETADETHKLVKTWSSEHKTSLVSVQKVLLTDITRIRDAQQLDAKHTNSLFQALQTDINIAKDIANQRFRQQVILMLISCLCVLAFLGTYVSTLLYQIRVAIYIGTFVVPVALATFYSSQSDAKLLESMEKRRTKENVSKSARKQKGVL